MSDQPELLRATTKLFMAIRKCYRLTHVGAMEGRSRRDPVVVWGVQCPDPTLRVWNADVGVWRAVERAGWEALTWMPPPWPWLPDGSGVDYARERE